MQPFIPTIHLVGGGVGEYLMAKLRPAGLRLVIEDRSRAQYSGTVKPKDDI